LRQDLTGTRDVAPPEAVARAGLTRREVDVLFLLARRLTDKEMADALSISHRTAMHHVSNILSKLGLESRRQVPDWADEHGIV
jgi:DNA-binding NarL/FixJ family response regulator